MKYTKEETQARWPKVNWIGETFYIGSDAVIGSRAHIESGAYIESGAVIRSDAYIGSRAHIGSDAVIGSRAHIESDAVILSICAKYNCNIVPFEDHVEIRIGCETWPIERWEKEAEGRKSEFDAEWWDSTGKRIYKFLKGEAEHYQKGRE